MAEQIVTVAVPRVASTRIGGYVIPADSGRFVWSRAGERESLRLHQPLSAVLRTAVAWSA